MAASDYPAQLEVDGPLPQSRVTVFFRILLVIPHFIVMAVLGVIAFVLYLVSWFAILFTGSYPAGMMSFTVGVMQWGARVQGYMYLLTDRYPPFAMGADPAYPIRLSIAGQVEGRSRLTTFWPIRLILAIPHLIILNALNYAIEVVVFVCWFIALFTGSVPAGMHNFIAGYSRWYNRAYSYVLNLHDWYPPFSFS